MSSTITRTSPSRRSEKLADVPVQSKDEITIAVVQAKEALREWKSKSIGERAQGLRKLAVLLKERAATIIHHIAHEVGKPVRYGTGEIERCCALLENVARYESERMEIECESNAFLRYVPVGVIALMTPWNNPAAIPIGKIAPALLYGNAVVWKPSPAATTIAFELLHLFREAGFPSGVLEIVTGDATTAETLMTEPSVDAVTLTGSIHAGESAAGICSRRMIPFQGELGGNNASIVWPDCNLQNAAAMIAEGAFAFCGQRCTANRRAIVHSDCYEEFLQLLRGSVEKMSAGDPYLHQTQIGPLISVESRNRISGVIARAKEAGYPTDVFRLHTTGEFSKEAYLDPVMVCCEDPKAEIVQQETFGPVLVIQRADSWEQALALCNGVQQGLAAALFSNSQTIQQEFLLGAQAGILKINRSTSDAGVNVPFGGWKRSGVGPPEHGPSNREFYTRAQSIYW